uniref:ribosomal protein L28 n=1 Tax=Pachymeniopsis lanceolata TaxID=151733 RepID=UPI002A7F611C|nr:ribosomal protein L28 [Pachymeniopsis lanceolata]WOL37333.1 ribosomal protein L28 [Pachymeniopsis lanceolata]
MAKICQITKKKSNNGYSISHSHVKTKKIQQVNLQNKKIWSHTKKRWLKLRISTKAIKSLHKLSIEKL